jgi:hypothetical protein
MHPVRLCSHLAGISKRDAHRIFDEGLLPVGVTGYPRALSPLGCILASFLFGPGPIFTVAARQHIISIIHQRHKDHDSFEALALLDQSDWQVDLGNVKARLAPCAALVISRWRLAQESLEAKTDSLNPRDGSPKISL